MWNDKKEIRDPHKVEATLEILTRSPHNRILLRYNCFGRILLERLRALSEMLASDGESFDCLFSLTRRASCFESLQMVMRTVYNFLPSLHHASWLALESVFASNTSTVLENLCSVFAEPPWYELSFHFTLATRARATWSARSTARWSCRR